MITDSEESRKAAEELNKIHGVEKPTLLRPNGDPYIVHYELDDEDCERSFVWLTEAQRFAARFPAYEIRRSGVRIQFCEDYSGEDDDRVLQAMGIPNASER